MAISTLSDLGTTGARQLLHRLALPDPPPFALLHRPGPGGGAVELMTGGMSHVSLLADLPLPPTGTRTPPGPDLLAVVPFRQISERGYACRDDGAPILALAVRERVALPLPDALDALPDVEVRVSERGFEPDDDEYERVVRRVVDGDIGAGEGSNFVIRRSFNASLARYRPAVAMTVFRRLLAAERNAHWTFLVHTGDRTFVGASPERHVRVAGGTARMNPISGTYRYPPSGARLDGVLDFLADQKEIDELYMVVDEELKMLGAVCDRGARVYGPYLREMASLAHTEYVLEGATSMDVREVLRETMFAPTVVGSPLENACRVIVRHEHTGRGYYGGAIALFGHDAAGRSTMDSTILIRTAEVGADGTLRIDVGATLVRDSRPRSEVAETWAKVDALLAATGLRRAPNRPRVATGRPARGPIADDPRVRRALRRRNAGLSSFWLARPAPPPARPARAARTAAQRVLIADAEDRFTLMLGHQLRSLGHEVTVRSVRRIEPADVDGFDAVVLGPGPGDPLAVTDPRIAKLHALVRRMLARGVPFVAECLSHQILCAVLGLRLFRRDRPNQGTQRRIDLFGVPELVGFYNSYAARCGTDRAGAVELCRDPRTGEVHACRGARFASVQFHVESVLTQRGADILAGLVAWARGV